MLQALSDLNKILTRVRPYAETPAERDFITSARAALDGIQEQIIELDR